MTVFPAAIPNLQLSLKSDASAAFKQTQPQIEVLSTPKTLVKEPDLKQRLASGRYRTHHMAASLEDALDGDVSFGRTPVHKAETYFGAVTKNERIRIEHVN